MGFASPTLLHASPSCKVWPVLLHYSAYRVARNHLALLHHLLPEHHGLLLLEPSGQQPAYLVAEGISEVKHMSANCVVPSSLACGYCHKESSLRQSGVADVSLAIGWRLYIFVVWLFCLALLNYYDYLQLSTINHQTPQRMCLFSIYIWAIYTSFSDFRPDSDLHVANYLKFHYQRHNFITNGTHNKFNNPTLTSSSTDI